MIPKKSYASCCSLRFVAVYLGIERCRCASNKRENCLCAYKRATHRLFNCWPYDWSTKWRPRSEKRVARALLSRVPLALVSHAGRPTTRRFIAIENLYGKTVDTTAISKRISRRRDDMTSIAATLRRLKTSLDAAWRSNKSRFAASNWRFVLSDVRRPFFHSRLTSAARRLFEQLSARPERRRQLSACAR